MLNLARSSQFKISTNRRCKARSSSRRLQRLPIAGQGVCLIQSAQWHPVGWPFAARARQRGVELPLVISDHADWDELTQTIRDVGASEVWITHGREDAIVYWATQNGFKARPLDIAGYEDEGD